MRGWVEIQLEERGRAEAEVVKQGLQKQGPPARALYLQEPPASLTRCSVPAIPFPLPPSAATCSFYSLTRMLYREQGLC